MPRSFFVVWHERHGPPQCKHDTRMSAITEAKRLAANHPGESFHVLELVGTACKVDVTFEEAFREDDGPPF